MDTRISVLDPKDWGRVAPAFVARSVALPDPSLAQITVAEQGDRIVGFVVLQLVAHLEPIYVTPEGRHVWPRLVKTALAAYPGPVYAFAPDPTIEGMATHAGFTKLPWSVFSCHS